MRYLTDGFHLYEVLSRHENYGLTRGTYLTVSDCRSGRVRQMAPIEVALCEAVSDGD